MKYLLSQVFNKRHVLSQRPIGIVDTIDEANQEAKDRGFSEFAPYPEHDDAYRTDPMLYEENDKVVGSTILCAIEFSEFAQAAETMTDIGLDPMVKRIDIYHEDSEDEVTQASPSSAV